MENVPGPQPLQSINFFHKITIVNICLQIFGHQVSSAKQSEIGFLVKLRGYVYATRVWPF